MAEPVAVPTQEEYDAQRIAEEHFADEVYEAADTAGVSMEDADELVSALAMRGWAFVRQPHARPLTARVPLYRRWQRWREGGTVELGARLRELAELRKRVHVDRRTAWIELRGERYMMLTSFAPFTFNSVRHKPNFLFVMRNDFRDDNLIFVARWPERWWPRNPEVDDGPG